MLARCAERDGVQSVVVLRALGGVVAAEPGGRPFEGGISGN